MVFFLEIFFNNLSTAGDCKALFRLGVLTGVLLEAGLSDAMELEHDESKLLPPLASVTTWSGALGGEANIEESEK